MTTQIPTTGFRSIGRDIWHGGGYCGICGDTRHYTPLFVTWWDPDDGWKTGVLCPSCTVECKEHPPKDTDYAFEKHYGEQPSKLNADDLATLAIECDEDDLEFLNDFEG